MTVTISRRTLLSALLGLAATGVVQVGAQPQPTKLLFVHGRGQAGLDPNELKKTWLKSLALGAHGVGLQLPDSLEVEFPYYGDELQRFVDQAKLPLTGDIQARGGSGQNDTFLAFQAEIAQSIRERAGVTDAQILEEYGDNPHPRGPLNWEWVHAILAAIDRYGGGLSRGAIEEFTRDVYLYTTYPSVRSAVDTIVRQALSTDPTVVVAHSLGTVVAYNVLHDDSRRINVPLFVTLGSPLGIRAIRDQLVPISYPTGVKDWFNAFDTRDIVALFPLDGQSFAVTPPIRNFSEVKNHTADRHGIDGYLDDREVARTTLTALSSQ